MKTLLDACTEMRIFFFEKKGKGYNAYLFPNDVTRSIRQDIIDLYKFYIGDKEIVDYSLVDTQKETIQKLSTTELPQWESIKGLIDNFPITNAPILTREKITDKIKMYIIECTINDKTVYIASKYSHKKSYSGIEFSMIGNTFKKINRGILTLGDCMDCFIYNNDVYILLETHFNSIFNFHKKIMDTVEANISEIDTWDFFDNNNIAGELVGPRKGRLFLKIIDSDDLAEWKKMTHTKRKSIIKKDPTLSDKFDFDKNNRIKFTKACLGELFKLFANNYFKSIITGKTGAR